MKLLVATKETQGRRKNDFNFCKDGEIVMLPVLECSQETVDGPCGCKRAWEGIDSHKPTTTAKVVEKEFTLEQLAQIVKDFFKQCECDEISDSDATGEAELMVEMAENYLVGDICERRGDYIANRVPIPAEVYIRDSLLVHLSTDDIKPVNTNWPNGYTKVAEINSNDWDEIFRWAQNDSTPWLSIEQVINNWERPLHPGAKENKNLPGCRSLSVGDVIKWGNEVWIVQPMGFTKI